MEVEVEWFWLEHFVLGRADILRSISLGVGADSTCGL